MARRDRPDCRAACRRLRGGTHRGENHPGTSGGSIIPESGLWLRWKDDILDAVDFRDHLHHFVRTGDLFLLAEK